jgi:sporulation protein YlmC with PRC-barrel domain
LIFPSKSGTRHTLPPFSLQYAQWPVRNNGRRTGMESSSFENIRASRVEGTEVYNPEGDHLGQIDDLVIGKRDGEVKYAIMSFGGFLGIGKRFHPLPWSMLEYDPAQGGYVVALGEQALRDAPHYDAEELSHLGGARYDDYSKVLGEYYGRYGLPL